MLQSLSRALKSALLALAPGVCVIGDERCCCGLQRRVIARRLYELLRTPMIFSRIVGEASLSASAIRWQKRVLSSIAIMLYPNTRQIAKSRISMCDAILRSALHVLDIESPTRPFRESPTIRSQDSFNDCPGDVHLTVIPASRQRINVWGCAWPMGLSQTDSHRLTRKILCPGYERIEASWNTSRIEMSFGRVKLEMTSLPLREVVPLWKVQFGDCVGSVDFVYCTAGI